MKIFIKLKQITVATQRLLGFVPAPELCVRADAGGHLELPRPGVRAVPLVLLVVPSHPPRTQVR